MRTSILALPVLLAITLGFGEAKAQQVTRHPLGFGEAKAQQVTRPSYPPGLYLYIIDVQVDPSDVWADGSGNSYRDCFTNPSYPDKTVCAKRLELALQWGSTPDGRFVSGERRPMFAIFELINTTNATTYSGYVTGVWENHDNSIGFENVADADRDYAASTKWSFTTIQPHTSQWGVIAWTSGITNAGRGDVLLTLNVTDPLGIPSYDTSFSRSLSAEFTYGTTDFDIVQKLTNSFNGGLEQVHAAEGWVYGASFKTTADPQVCHQSYTDSVIGNFLNAFMPAILGDPPGNGCYIQIHGGGQIIPTGAGDVLHTHEEGQWFHIPNRGAPFYFSPDQPDRNYYVYSILFNRASHNDNAFWALGIKEVISLLAGVYARGDANVPDSYFASTLNPGNVVKAAVGAGLEELVFSLFEQNCDGVTSLALGGFAPDYLQTLINSASNFGGPEYQDFVETQTAALPGPNAFGNCKNSNYIVKRRISRRTDARVSTIDPPVAQIKPGQSAKFHASLSPYYSVSNKVYWKAFDRSAKEVGTWKLDPDTHWATFTPPPNAYSVSSFESVPNGGFESGDFASWIVSGQTSVQSNVTHTGKKAAWVGGNTKNNSVVSTTAGGGGLPAGHPQLSFWIYPHCVNTAGNGILVTLYDGQANRLAYPYNSNDLGCGADNDAWKQVTLDLTPWAGSQVVVQFKNLHGAGLNSSYFYLDDVSIFTQGGAVTPGEVVFRIAAAGDNNLFIPYAQACTGNYQVPSICSGCEGCIASAYAVAVPAPSSFESVPNGGFESGDFTSWIASGQTTVQSNVIHTGKKAAWVGGNTKSTSVVSTTVGGGSLPAGHPQLSFWIYPHCVNTPGNGILVTLYDGQAHPLAYPYNSTDLGCGADNDAWKQVTLDLTPWAGTQVVVEFKNLHGAGLNSSYFYLDDVSIFTQDLYSRRRAVSPDASGLIAR